MDALVTVILPVYNVERYLPDCLAAIRAQTFRDYRLVIVNDGSTDDSGAICRAYADGDSRVLYVEQENQGLSGARNKGLAYAHGEFVSFIDSDDRPDPAYLECLVREARRSEADVTICGYRMLADDGTLIGTTRFPHAVMDERAYWKTAFTDETLDLYVWNKLYRRHVIGDSRFPERELAQDYAFNLAVMPRASRVAFLDEVLYSYCRWKTSVTMTSKTATNCDILKDDVLALGYFKDAGYKDCIPACFHRAIGHLARRSPSPNDDAANRVYRESAQKIHRFYRENRHLLPRHVRLRYRAIRILGRRGYLAVSRCLQALKTRMPKKD